jgi:hypothetical protein
MPRRPPEGTARLEVGSTSAGNSTTQKGVESRVSPNFHEKHWKSSHKWGLGVGALAPTSKAKKKWALAPEEMLFSVRFTFMR